MTAQNAGAGIGPPKSKNEKATGQGGNLIGATVMEKRLSISAESVKREASRHFAIWLRTGIDYHCRLARAAADAARKGAA